MIFVCVGSREYQFDRLLKELDVLVGSGIIKEPLFAQIGQSGYIPKNYEFSRFLTKSEFSNHLNKASMIISHGGTGALIGALKLQKKVIAVPRLAKYNEHTDDHQLQICELLHSKNFICDVVTEINKLKESIKNCRTRELETFEMKSNVLNLIQNFIQ